MLGRRTMLVATAALLTACARGGDPPGDAGRIDDELVASLTAADATTVARAVNEFGFDLLEQVADGRHRGNTVVSPLSVAVLLAMVLAGARGETARAMARVLHLEQARDVRVGALLRLLADTRDVTLGVADALWARKGLELRDDYTRFVRDTFGATVREADLAAPGTAADIDRWADDKTGGRIHEIAEDLGLPSADAVLVLLNAVYFLGTWTTRFERKDTRPQPFTLAGGESVRVPMMSLREEKFGYARQDGFTMLRLPYGKHRRYGMEVMLPAEGTGLADLRSGLDLRSWRGAVRALTEREVDEVALPRFELTWRLELDAALKHLGMGAAFGGGADFSRMFGSRGAVLGPVVHKTYIRVDEKGTEAAAVTGGAMATSLRTDRLVFRADRPFAFTVSDRKTGTVLFLGAVTDPRG